MFTTVIFLPTMANKYMAEKSPYYNAIDALLRARIKYVAGGQDMKVTKLNGYEIMSSVRYGKGAEEVNQLGTAETRNQGMLVLTANRPDMKLGANDRLVVNMEPPTKIRLTVHCFSANLRALRPTLRMLMCQLDWFAIRIIKGT